jgi:hypothetical protein
MRCPGCGAEISDVEAEFCSRCGSSLRTSEGEVTSRLEVGDSDDHGSPETRAKGSQDTWDARRVVLKEQRTARAASRGGRFAEAAEMVDHFGRRLRGHGWIDAAAAAALAFLVLLSTGAVLLLAAKFQSSTFGAGADPLDVFTAVVILGLGSIRVPVHLGDLVFTLLPLGAFAAIASGIVWATRSSFRREQIPESAAWEGLKVGAPFALICWLFALVFRFRDPPAIVHAGAIGALLLGGLWGSLFGALGVATLVTSPVALLRNGLSRLGSRSRILRAGIQAGGAMLGLAALMAAGALLLWIIVGLARGAQPRSFGGGDALSALIYLAAFAPNVLVAVLSLSVGAPIEVGAQVTFGGRLVGAIKDYSIFGWADDPAPAWVFLLLVIPLLACLGGGVWLRGHMGERPEGARMERERSIAIAAATFGVALFLLALLGEARLGAALVRNRGVGLVAPNPWLVGVLSFAWAAAAGLAGWHLSELGRRRKEALRR